RESAWLSTMRMAASSSARRMVCPAMWSVLVFGRLGVGALGNRQKDTKTGAARLAVAIDDAAMVAHDLGDEGKTQAGARELGGDERVEKERQDISGDAGPVILDD